MAAAVGQEGSGQRNVSLKTQRVNFILMIFIFVYQWQLMLPKKMKEADFVGRRL